MQRAGAGSRLKLFSLDNFQHLYRLGTRQHILGTDGNDAWNAAHGHDPERCLRVRVLLAAGPLLDSGELLFSINGGGRQPNRGLMQDACGRRLLSFVLPSSQIHSNRTPIQSACFLAQIRCQAGNLTQMHTAVCHGLLHTLETAR